MLKCKKSTSQLHDWSDYKVADFYTDDGRPTLLVCSNCGMVDDKKYFGKKVTFDFLEKEILYQKGRIMKIENI